MQKMLRVLGDRRAALQNGEETQKGFTLIELLVVVIIIGILAGIAIPVFLNQRQSAWQAEAESDLKNAALAAETYSVRNNGSYANMDDADLTAGGFQPSRTPTFVTVTSADRDNFVLTANHPDLDADLTWNSATGGLGAWPNP